MSNNPKNVVKKSIKTFRHSITCFTFTVFWSFLMFAAFWGGIFTVSNSIERRYNFDSQTTGIMLGSSEWGSVIAMIPATYIGGRTHMPRFIATSLTFLAVTFFLFMTPHFVLDIPPKYTPLSPLEGKNTLELSKYICTLTNRSMEDLGNTGELDSHQSYVNKVAFAIFLIAMVGMGSIACPAIALLYPFIDMNSTHKQAAVYTGFLRSAHSFGSTIGAFIGAWAATIYVDLSDSPIDQAHPDWIGAWWILLAVVGTGVSISAPLLYCFPRSLKSEDRVKEDMELDAGNCITNKQETNVNQTDVGANKDKSCTENQKQPSAVEKADQNKAKVIKKGILAYLKEFVDDLWRILKNPVFVCITGSRVLLEMAHWGYYSFLAKYIGVQFSVVMSTANLITGVTPLCVGIGTLVAGQIISRCNWSFTRTLYVMMAVAFVGFCNIIALLFIQCPDIQWASLDVTDVCTASCNCVPSAISPVCDVAAGYTFVSACYAGCLQNEVANSIISGYSNCSCSTHGFVIPGSCSDCNIFPAYIVLLATAFLAIGFLVAPLILGTVRSVGQKDKALAMGVHVTFVSCFAWLMSPVIFGIIADHSCSLWQTIGDKRGYCQMYSKSAYRTKLHGLTAGLMFLAFVFISLSAFFAKRNDVQWEPKKINQCRRCH